MRLITSVAVFLFMVSVANAQGPQGVAIVLAPEQSFGMCFAQNPDKGFECARQQCTANGTPKSDCLRVQWCYPAGWTADIFAQHKEGPHWHQYLCGWNSRADVEAAAKVVCEGDSSEWLIECALVGLWDPEGNEIPLQAD